MKPNDPPAWLSSLLRHGESSQPPSFEGILRRAPRPAPRPALPALLLIASIAGLLWTQAYQARPASGPWSGSGRAIAEWRAPSDTLLFPLSAQP